MNIIPDSIFKEFAYTNLNNIAWQLKTMVKSKYCWEQEGYCHLWEDIFQQTKMSPFVFTITSRAVFLLGANNQVFPTNMRSNTALHFADRNPTPIENRLGREINDFLQRKPIGYSI